MVDCVNHKNNLKNCACTYSSCGRKGYCCECAAYHRLRHELPGCFFDRQAERTYDRSVDNFKK